MGFFVSASRSSGPMEDTSSSKSKCLRRSTVGAVGQLDRPATSNSENFVSDVISCIRHEQDIVGVVIEAEVYADRDVISIDKVS